jgi:hypothetical protein
MSLRVVEDGNLKKVYRGSDTRPEALVEKRGESKYRWTNWRGLDPDGEEKSTTPPNSTGTCKTEAEAFLELGYKIKK